MKFNIEDYKGKYAMHCKTEEEAKDFCKYLGSLSRKWCDGTKYTEMTYWNFDKDKTCYDFNLGAYGSIEYFYNKKYQILEKKSF